jgi:hypothetical protein
MTIKAEIDILILPISCPFLLLSHAFVSGGTSDISRSDFAGLATPARV